MKGAEGRCDKCGDVGEEEEEEEEEEENPRQSSITLPHPPCFTDLGFIKLFFFYSNNIQDHMETNTHREPNNNNNNNNNNNK